MPKSGESMRLFLAFELADVQRAALDQLRRNAPLRLKQAARWVPKENLHLTLHFLGDLPREKLPELKAALRTVEAGCANLALRALGRFPRRGKARVLWAGVAEDEALRDCHEQLARALTRLDLPLSAAPFTPHITLARLRPPLEYAELAGWLAEQAGWRDPRARVSHFTLFESQLGVGVPRYIPLARYPLAQ